MLSGDSNSTEHALISSPNFVVFATDFFRHDLLGCAGHSIVQTPNIDRLASDGVRLDRCYSVHPLCMATRSTWFTGLTPRGHGTRCNGIPLDRSLPTMPGALLKAGYRTGAVGKLHLTPYFPDRVYNEALLTPEDWPESSIVWRNGLTKKLPSPYYGLETVDLYAGVGHNIHGDYAHWLSDREPCGLELLKPPHGVAMDQKTNIDVTWKCALPEELHVTSWAAERAKQFLHTTAAQDNPFFLWLSVPDPHPPYTATKPWCDMYRPEDMPPPNRRDGELEDLPPHYRQLFETGARTTGRFPSTNISDDDRNRVAAMVCGMVSQCDAMVGRVLQTLDELKLTENTVVIFMSDHGQMLGDHWMHGVTPSHMDGILRVPSIWRLPNVFQHNVVCSALASHLDFAPTILDLAGVPIPERGPRRDDLSLQPAWPGQSLKPLLCGDADKVQDSVIAENDDDFAGLRMRTLITEEYHLTIYTGESYGELYDLRKDPDQLYNLWNDTNSQTTKRDLQIELLYRLASTDDTLPRPSQ